MKKLLLSVTLCLCSLTVMAVEISYSHGTLFVTDGVGEKVEVISLTGNKVMEVQIESPAQKIELNIPKGCYIVKVGKVVRKVSVQ